MGHYFGRCCGIKVNVRRRWAPWFAWRGPGAVGRPGRPVAAVGSGALWSRAPGAQGPAVPSRPFVRRQGALGQPRAPGFGGGSLPSPPGWLLALASGVAPWFRRQDNKWHVCPGSHVLDPRDIWNPGRAPGTLAPDFRDPWVPQMKVLHRFYKVFYQN